MHRAFLAHHSDVFNGMFQVVSSEHVEDTFDGAPLVTMPDDDQAEHFAELLAVIYKPRYAMHCAGIHVSNIYNQ